MKIIKKLSEPKNIIRSLPLSKKSNIQIKKDRKEIENILAGKDDRILIITGPCSAWPYEAVLDYAKLLKELSDKVQDKIKIVLRVYIQKPRTTKGWTGPVNQPDPLGAPDAEEGLKYCRSLMIKAVEIGLPIADEALFTHNAENFIKLLSWVAIGARSVEDQEHRIFASAIDCPVGMKNGTGGSIEIATNGIIAAQNSHTIVFEGNQVETTGNKFAHLVLRGGKNSPNYSKKYLLEAKGLMEKGKIKNPAIIVDASHDNCRINGIKDCNNQSVVIKEVLDIIREDISLKKLVKGFMLESFIKSGNQKVDLKGKKEIDQGGLSITDPCLSWKDTEKLILDLAKKL